jgi:hypothetical protein
MARPGRLLGLLVAEAQGMEALDQWGMGVVVLGEKPVGVHVAQVADLQLDQRLLQRAAVSQRLQRMSIQPGWDERRCDAARANEMA